MSRMGYLLLAYSITWLVIFGYTLALGRRQAKLEREIAALKDAVTGLRR